MIITRFAPSPTGLLHVGSLRPALANYLFARQKQGKFILRIDDTDAARSTQEFKEQLLCDLKWLGLDWDELFYQSQRLDRYQQVVAQMLASGRLYECFETEEELSIKRKIQLASGKPPIYDRQAAALHLTASQKQLYLNEGRKPHYRFKLEPGQIIWHDLIRAEVKYKAQDLSDPIVIRQDGSFTYMLCSAIDDFDYAISHIFRGEDHINNTAIQIQMLQAMGAPIPIFGHLSFLKAKDEKISKRIGGFEVASLQKAGIEPMALNSFFSYIGTSKAVVAAKDLQQLVEDFDVTAFSASPTIYNADELWLLNHKLLAQLEYSQVKEHLAAIGADAVDEDFWLATRANLNNIEEIKLWWTICKKPLAHNAQTDKEFIKIATQVLPAFPLTQNSWQEWTSKVSALTGKKGRDLFMPLRLALTGIDHGPEMKLLLPLIDAEQIKIRLAR